MNNNLIQNVTTPTSNDHATNKGYCDLHFLNKQKGGVMMGQLSMNENDLIALPDTPKFGNSAGNKNYVDGELSSQLGKKLDKAADIDMKNHQITNLHLPSNQRDAACVEFVNNKIKQLNETHISSSVNKKDAFRYLMEDTDKSSSENNIDVLGINDFPESPHQINEKAYFLKLLFEKESPNQYRSRLGFNLHPLPVGYYTMVVEWFPPEMYEVSVTPQATTISISNYTTKTFEKYTKTLIHFNRWNSSSPQYIFPDLHGTVRVSSFIKIGNLIIYGLKETVSNVDPSVYDTDLLLKMDKW